MGGNVTTYGTPLGSVLRILVRLTVFGVFLLTLLCAVIYVIGCYREFSEERQFALLQFTFAVATLLGVSSIAGAFLDFGYALIHKRALPLLGMLGYTLMLLFGALAAMAAGFIISAAGGNR